MTLDLEVMDDLIFGVMTCMCACSSSAAEGLAKNGEERDRGREIEGVIVCCVC